MSDLHVRRSQAGSGRGFDAHLIKCIAQVNAAAPDLVIATGDLTQTGSAEEYRHLRELMNALSRPYYLMPGNHDDREALRRVYRDHAYLFETDTHASYVVDVNNWRLLMFDSTKHRRPGGYVDTTRLTWLDSRLRERTHMPTLLALHHPPFAAGVWPLDWFGFANVQELENVVRSHGQVRRVVSGHVHCVRAASWGGTFACTSPSPMPQHLLIGTGQHLPKIHFERPGFLLHSLDDANGSIVTRVHRTHGAIEELG
jgi:3',5'-cyclic AMP phosphodiesterase CpdA